MSSEKTYHVQRWPDGDHTKAEVVDPGPYNKEQGRTRAQEMSRGIKGDTFISLNDNLKVGPGKHLTKKPTASGKEALTLEQ
jgi:hypothetical protein